jgi:hypothetical protein
MILARLRGAGRWALLAGLLLGVIGLAPAEAEAKRIKIKNPFRPGRGLAYWPPRRDDDAP